MSSVYGDGGDDGTVACKSCDASGWWAICPWCDKGVEACQCAPDVADMVLLTKCEDCDGEKYYPVQC